mmetsp:Transcript_38430/g.80585  ORF Transcript_38430/g.80585 Transcript_38430/m.80585 type:complete len:92 (-) Transcript_38430:112-387(-)
MFWSGQASWHQTADDVPLMYLTNFMDCLDQRSDAVSSLLSLGPAVECGSVSDCVTLGLDRAWRRAADQGTSGCEHSKDSSGIDRALGCIVR